jgi:hypothetical protein
LKSERLEEIEFCLNDERALWLDKEVALELLKEVKEFKRYKKYVMYFVGKDKVNDIRLAMQDRELD